MWCHWVWFLVPHGSVAYVMWREPERFPAAAARMYAVFDLGAVFYWAIPTAPPWYAARHGRLQDARMRPVRRMMIEYGEQFWGDRWTGLYDVLGGNPLAAMPSLHFATSLMAAHLLGEVGPVAGAVGGSYAALLGLALVYLGEHYAADLASGRAAGRDGADPVSSRASGCPGTLSAPRGAATAGGGRLGAWAMRGGAPIDHGHPGADRADDEAPDGQVATRLQWGAPAQLGPDGGDAAHPPHPAEPGGIDRLHRLCRRVSLLRAAQAAGPARHLEPASARQRVVAGAGRRARVLLVPGLRGPVPRRLRPRRDAASTGAPATRSPWPGWRRRGCSPPPAPAVSR